MIIKRSEMRTVEMQMGPMIDIVFLLLVFFMVTARPVKPESDVGIRLPGTVAQEESLDLPDEQRILIEASGQVVLNDMPHDDPASRDLPQLLRTLKRFKESADANRSDALVTIAADDATDHQRIVDVLNTCGQAGIVGVTLATDGEDEDGI